MKSWLDSFFYRANSLNYWASNGEVAARRCCTGADAQIRPQQAAEMPGDIFLISFSGHPASSASIFIIGVRIKT